jgi:hypothetical protein
MLSWAWSAFCMVLLAGLLWLLYQFTPPDVAATGGSIAIFGIALGGFAMKCWMECPTDFDDPVQLTAALEHLRPRVIWGARIVMPLIGAWIGFTGQHYAATTVLFLLVFFAAVRLAHDADFTFEPGKLLWFGSAVAAGCALGAGVRHLLA